MTDKKKLYSKIYDRYIDKIYRFIFLKVSSQEIAQDLTSETFLRGWESFKNGTKIENPQAFLYQIARNIVTDHYREKGKCQLVSTEATIVADPTQDLEEKSFLDSDIETVKAVLADLKEDYQNVIVWRYIDDLPIQEIAKLQNKSEEATRVQLHRALKALKDEINQTEEEAKEA